MGRFADTPPGPQVGVEEVLGYPVAALLDNRQLLLQQVHTCKIWRWDRTKLETNWKGVLAKFDDMYEEFIKQELSSGVAKESLKVDVMAVLHFCAVLIRNCLDPLSYMKSLKVVPVLLYFPPLHQLFFFLSY